MNFRINTITNQDINTALMQLKEKIDLVILKPPIYSIDKSEKQFLEEFGDTMKLIASKTCTGGICCLILDEHKKENTMSMLPIKLFAQAIEKKDENNFWTKQEEIIWVKYSKIQSNSSENGYLIDFEQTAFATIHLLEKNESEFEYIDSEERISKLNLKEEIKQEWSDSVWFVEAKNEQFDDHIPVEVITRLVRIFSEEGNMILDPFAGYGATALVCKNNKRNFVCIESDMKKINLAIQRLEE